MVIPTRAYIGQVLAWVLVVPAFAFGLYVWHRVDTDRTAAHAPAAESRLSRPDVHFVSCQGAAGGTWSRIAIAEVRRDREIERPGAPHRVRAGNGPDLLFGDCVAGPPPFPLAPGPVPELVG